MMEVKEDLKVVAAKMVVKMVVVVMVVDRLHIEVYIYY